MNELVIHPGATEIGRIALSIAVGMAAGYLLFRRYQVHLAEAEVKARRAQEESDARLRAIIEAVEVSLWEWNPETGGVLLDENWNRVRGLPADTPRSNSLDEWLGTLHSEDRPRVTAALQAHLSDPTVRYDVEYRVRDGLGRWLWINSRGRLVSWDENRRPLRMIGIIQDVTRRRELEEQVRENADQLRNILDTAPDGIVVIDATGRIESFNHAAEEMFGCPAAEALGRSITTLMAPDRPQYDNGALMDYLATGRAGLIGRGREVRALRADGTILPLQITVSEHRVRDARKFTGILRDVSDQRLIEQLARQRQDLETLLHVASHDLREPLRSIASFSQILRDRYSDRLDAKGADFLTRVVRAADRMRQLIEDVVTLSRARHGDAELERVEGRAVVDAALASLEGQVRASRAKIEIARDLPVLLADRRWTIQAVYNLVANALKFTRNGEPPQIRISGFTAPGETGLVIADRGPGIPRSSEDRIFQLFQRAVGREVEGTGAGLAIVRRVAERHRGRTWVEARAGGGSEFYLTFAERSGAEAA